MFEVMKTGLPSLEDLFHPESVAVVGVSNDMTRPNSGRRFLHGAMNAAFKGKVYAVGLQGGEVYGTKIYPTLKDVPGTVDYVISAIPAVGIFQLIEDARAKRAKALHLFTAGFSETGRKEAADMEVRIINKARESGLRIIGPNCVGIYSPASGLSFEGSYPMVPGTVSVMTQSGGNARYAIREGIARGIYFSKVISFGNAYDVNEGEILEFLTRDSDTGIILVYIEGVRDGLRFQRALTEAMRHKPVIVYKSGMTEAGARATASHTASIAGSNAVWDSMLKQAGAPRVYGIEELIDIADMHARLPYVAGLRTGVLGVGGGVAVLAADVCAKAGLQLPVLSPQTQARLMEIMVSDAGCSFNNPIDIRPEVSRDQMRESVIALMRSGEIDLLMVQMATWLSLDSQALIRVAGDVLSARDEIRGRCCIVVQHVTGDAMEMDTKAEDTFRLAGFPVFPSLERGATAVSRYVQMMRRRASR